MLNKLILILGPTASGKTNLSIKLAKKYNGEVVSADSRQVYRGLNIGSGKITKKEMKGVPHYLLDVANPKTRFTVSQYQKLAIKAIRNIQEKGKLPILVGGTGFYIQSIVDGIAIPEVKPDLKLRKELEKLSLREMFEKLKRLDPARAGNIDKNNPRRLIRALEIVLKTGKPVPRKLPREVSSWSMRGMWNILQIGIKKEPQELKRLINKRLQKRLKHPALRGKSRVLPPPLINEAKKLRASGLSWKRLEELGLEYRFVAQYLQNKISYQEMIDKIQKESEHFAKRQMTWFRRDKRIYWINNYKEADKLIKKFL